MMRPRIALSSPFDLDLPRPEWISLHQALLVISDGFLPIPESVFRASESFPPPDSIDARRRLVLALATGRVRHRGELWQLRSATKPGSRAPNQSSNIVEDTYNVPTGLWLADKICFGKSELHIEEPPEGFSIQARHGDLFQVRRIVVRVEDVEKLCGSAKPTPASGRPFKREQMMDHFAYALAYVDALEVPVKRSSLIEALLEYSQALPEEKRLGKTVIGAFAGAVMGHISKFMDE